MASVLSDESDEDFSDYSQVSVLWEENFSEKSDNIDIPIPQTEKTSNLTCNILNREIYGRFTKNPRAKTEKIFTDIQPNRRFALCNLIKEHENLNHIFMGFTLCGQYFVSYNYTEKINEDVNVNSMFITTYEHELYLWKFAPGQKLRFVSKHKIFKHLKRSDVFDNFKIMQFPNDFYKLVCYGLSADNPDLLHITILTLPASNCKHCSKLFMSNNDSVNQGWCTKHGFVIHYMVSLSQNFPEFDPYISLAYPDHLVINAGHHIHILNVTTSEPQQVPINLPNLPKEEEKIPTNTPTHTFNDTMSELSESMSEHFGIVDTILEDFSEYDLESNECNKPFHELNISCEPLNVTGKSYHNTLVQNIVDPRVKRLQSNPKDYLFSVPQSSIAQKSEKSKIDKKIAEKAYEFIEENEKYEKISSFRKKRLAEKKYEFSEDNSENIVPFNSLRRDRRYLYRSQNRCIRSPDFNSLFLSPRSSGIRSPMQSPKSRNGQFSPNGPRNLYCPSLRNSPHHSKSPISPKQESARKFYVYSPSLESDCSDSDSRLILRTSVPSTCDTKFSNNSGLLIVDPKSETSKWMKKIVRRYSNGDFENCSLLSGQSRDEFNIPIEIPLLVHNLTDQPLDVVPELKSEQMTEMQLIATQRSFDFEHFVQRKAQKLCSEAQLEFMYCQDYDIKIIHICPINGHIICHAIIKIGAQKDPDTVLEHYCANFLFTWSIENDVFEVIDNKTSTKLFPADEKLDLPEFNYPKCQEVLVMDYCMATSKPTLRDFNEYFEICFETFEPSLGLKRSYRNFVEYFSDSD